MTSTTTDTAIDIDEAVADHLASSESLLRLFRERISPELILDGPISKAFNWAMNHIVSAHEAPTPQMIAYEHPGIEFHEIKCDIEWLIDKLRERHIRNQLKPVLRDAAQSLADSPAETVDYLNSMVAGVRSSTRARDIEIDASDWDSIMADYSHRVNNNMLEGVSLGFHEVDTTLGGLRPDTLSFIIARLKHGKSWFLLKSAVQSQIEGKQGVLFTPELSKKEMFERYVCMMSGIPYGLFINGKLMPEHYKRINDAKEIVQAHPHYLKIIQTPVDRRSVSELVDIAGEMGADVLYIDGVKYLQPSVTLKHVEEHHRVTKVCEELKAAASHFPIYCAAQFNREAAGIGEMADASAIGLSDGIGQIADLLLGLYRNKDMRANNVIELGVVESRATVQASWLIDWLVGMKSDLQVREAIIR